MVALTKLPGPLPSVFAGMDLVIQSYASSNARLTGIPGQERQAPRRGSL
jgi:hypothetical protein